MRFQKLDRRFIEIMIGLVLVLVGLSAGAQLISAGLVIIGLILLAHQFDRSARTESRQRAVEIEEEVMPAQPRADQVYAHALDAVRLAGLEPDETHVLPVDIGVMAFSGDQEPVIYRTRPILDNVDYLQPFVQLRLPTRAHGRIRFEIIDSDGQALFIQETDREFERGRNLVTPAARLPIHDAHTMHGNWELRVSADGMLIAEHRFEWQENTSKVIRRQLEEDGELSGEVRALVAESRLERMSLDELLSEQHEDEAPKQASKR